MLAAFALPRAQAQFSFDPKVCSKKGTLWQYGADYISYCIGYEGQGCATARDSDVCEQGQRDRRNEATSQVRKAVGDQRSRVLRLPPLTAERNPLLGKWSVEKHPRKKDAPTGMFDSVLNLGGTACEGLFGNGTTEFKATSWSSVGSYGSDSLGPIQYRGRRNGFG
jgi:hypothetical protein